jgi:hypothetical protein
MYRDIVDGTCDHLTRWRTQEFFFGGGSTKSGQGGNTLVRGSAQFAPAFSAEVENG